MLTVNNVSWKHRGRMIVKQVSLEVNSGEMLGLIGPNGSGKTTLLRLMAGIVKPTSGNIQLKGHVLSRMSRRDVARILAFVAQQVETIDRITVRDVVRLGRVPWLTPLRSFSKQDHAAVDAALDRVGMVAYQMRDWATLSGGERQRVHIARALAQTPQILLLDEPTNHLDIHHQLSILSLIKTLSLTTVIAIHDLNQALSCDRLAVMIEGELVAFGSPEETLTLETVRNVFTVEARQLIDPVDEARLLRFYSPDHQIQRPKI